MEKMKKLMESELTAEESNAAANGADQVVKISESLAEMSIKDRDETPGACAATTDTGERSTKNNFTHFYLFKHLFRQQMVL